MSLCKMSFHVLHMHVNKYSGSFEWTVGLPSFRWQHKPVQSACLMSMWSTWLASMLQHRRSFAALPLAILTLCRPVKSVLCDDYQRWSSTIAWNSQNYCTTYTEYYQLTSSADLFHRDGRILILYWIPDLNIQHLKSDLEFWDLCCNLNTFSAFLVMSEPSRLICRNVSVSYTVLKTHALGHVTLSTRWNNSSCWACSYQCQSLVIGESPGWSSVCI